MSLKILSFVVVWLLAALPVAAQQSISSYAFQPNGFADGCNQNCTVTLNPSYQTAVFLELITPDPGIPLSMCVIDLRLSGEVTGLVFDASYSPQSILSVIDFDMTSFPPDTYDVAVSFWEP